MTQTIAQAGIVQAVQRSLRRFARHCNVPKHPTSGIDYFPSLFGYIAPFLFLHLLPPRVSVYKPYLNRGIQVIYIALKYRDYIQILYTQDGILELNV